MYARILLISALIFSYGRLQAADLKTTDSSTEKTRSEMNKTDLSEFDHLDPQHVVPEKPLRQALTYFKTFRDQFPNQNFLVVIDYTKPATEKRMYVIDLKSGKVESHLTAHGRGSDPKKTGWAVRFGNAGKSMMTSLGFFRTAEVYGGKHGKSLKLDGLSPTNSNARSRKVVIHGADYVNEKNLRVGRSLGCPAVDPKVINGLISEIKGGALIYSFGKT